MQKIIFSLIGLIFLALILFTQYTGEETEKEVPTKEVPIKEKTIQAKSISSQKEVKTKAITTKVMPASTQTKQPLTPFRQNMDIKQDEVIPTNLKELEIEAFKTIQPLINKETQNIPDCLEKAETKEEAFACSATLRGLHKNLALAMGDFSGESPTGYPDDFIWNEETKTNMIKEIESGVQAMQETQHCMETSKTPEELKKCLNLELPE